jgi:hypothetical protein
LHYNGVNLQISKLFLLFVYLLDKSRFDTALNKVLLTYRALKRVLTVGSYTRNKMLGRNIFQTITRLFG